MIGSHGIAVKFWLHDDQAYVCWQSCLGDDEQCSSAGYDFPTNQAYLYSLSWMCSQGIGVIFSI